MNKLFLPKMTFAIFLILPLVISLQAQPILKKHFFNGPTFLFSRDIYVDYVIIYLLIDQINNPINNNAIEHYLFRLEADLNKTGALCQRIPMINLPEAPWNSKHQAFLIIRYPAKLFDRNIKKILKIIFSFTTGGHYLVYGKNFNYLNASEFETKINQSKQAAHAIKINYSVTLANRLYLLFSGKFNLFRILTVTNELISQNEQVTNQLATPTNENRYWLFVFYNFISDLIRIKASANDLECSREILVIDFEKNKIIIKNNNLKQVLFQIIKNNAQYFEKWYFNDYVQFFRNLNANNDLKNLLHLYSVCYFKDYSIFEINLKPINRFTNRMLNNPEQFIEFYSDDTF